MKHMTNSRGHVDASESRTADFAAVGLPGAVASADPPTGGTSIWNCTRRSSRRTYVPWRSIAPGRPKELW